MMRAPTHNEILLTEQRLNETRRQMVTATARAKAAIYDALVKPATLVGIAGAAGLAGYLIFRRQQVQRVNVSSGPSSTATAATAAAASTSLAGIVMAFAMRYAMRQLPGIGMNIFRHAVRDNRGAGSGRPSPVITRATSSGTLH